MQTVDVVNSESLVPFVRGPSKKEINQKLEALGICGRELILASRFLRGAAYASAEPITRTDWRKAFKYLIESYGLIGAVMRYRGEWPAERKLYVDASPGTATYDAVMAWLAVPETAYRREKREKAQAKRKKERHERAARYRR